MKLQSPTSATGLRTLAEVAARHGLHPGAIRKRLTQGRGEAIRIGSVWVFTEAMEEALARDMKPRPKRPKDEVSK